MTIDHISAWFMIVFSGLFSGATLIFAVERTNLWRQMPVDQYAVDFRRSLYRVDPLMPIMGTLTALGAVVFALNSNARAATFAWIGAALIVAIIIASLVFAEPINSKFRRLPEGQAPDGAEQLRNRWRHFHWGRTVVALASLACLAAAVTV